MHVLLTIPWFKLEGWTLPGSSFGIHPFGILVAAGVLFGARLSLAHAVRNRLRPDLLRELIGYVLGSGFVIGHVFTLVVYHPDKLMREPWRVFFIWEDLSSYGGVFGSVAGAYYWARLRKVPLLPMYDSLAYGFPLGWAFGRMGCFVVHDHPGKETTFFLGVENYQFPGLPAATRHDLGLYEVFWSLGVLALFLVLGRKSRPWGTYTALFVLLYAPYRFALDFLRASDRTYGGLTPGHYASVVALAVGVVLLLHVRSHGRDPLPPSLQASEGEVREAPLAPPAASGAV